MTMQLMWWLGIALEGMLIVRCLAGGHFRKYPFFFAYISCVLAIDCFSIVFYRIGTTPYAYWYWGTQFLSIIVGYGIVLEIFRLSLAEYPGADRLGRNLLLLLFGAVFVYVGFHAAMQSGWSPAKTTAELERDLRAVEALALGAIVVVIGYFRIGLGRNLKGLIAGFGFFIATGVVSLAVRSFAGRTFEPIFFYLQPACYLVTLQIWTVALWSYAPNPAPTALATHADYGALAASTRDALGAVRADIAKAVRS
jgi:hypothetical protein